MARRDDPDSNLFLSVPTAVLYHDKEQLLDGKMVLRKIELERARLRVIHERNGRWNLIGLLSPPNLKETVPTIIVRQGTILIEDRQAPAGTAPVEIKQVSLQILNDPLPTVTFEGKGVSAVLGP